MIYWVIGILAAIGGTKFIWWAVWGVLGYSVLQGARMRARKDNPPGKRRATANWDHLTP